MDPTLDRDLEREALLGDIICGDTDVLSLLNFVEEEIERDDDGSGHRMPEEGDHDDGSGDRLPEEGDHDDGSGDRTEGTVAKSSGEVYILIKPVLTN
jgi:hypothetical protein